MQRTRPLQASAPIHLIRQALYDSGSLMPVYHSNNPVDRTAEMTANYERLILGLGVSPRGQRAQARAAMTTRKSSQGSRSARGLGGTLPQLNATRPSDASAPGMSSEAASVAMARVVARLDAMSDGGPLSGPQLARLKNLSKLESTLVAATEQDDPDAMVAASQRLLAWLDAPHAEVADDAPPPPDAPRPGTGERGGRSRVATPDQAEEGGVVRLRPEPPAKMPPTLTRPSRQVDPAALREGLQKRLRKNWTRVMDLFKQWDVDADGFISEAEFQRGLGAIGIQAEQEAVGLLFADLERNAQGQVAFHELNRAIRAAPLSEAEKKRRAPAPVSVVVPLTRESYARAAEALARRRLGREADEEGEGEESAAPHKQRSPAMDAAGKAAAGTVWSAIEAKVAPSGPAKAPKWQGKVLKKVRLQVEKRKLEERRALADAQMVAFWGTPQRAPEAPRMRDGSIAGLEKRREAALQGGGSADGGLLEGELPAATDPTNGHREWLSWTEEEHGAGVAERTNRLAMYEQMMQQLQLERQGLAQGLEDVGKAHKATEPVAARAVDAKVMEVMKVRLEKKKRELLHLQRRANEMVLATEQLVAIIDSLRNHRSRHVATLRAMDDKEAQLDADGGTLLSTANNALEEHERLKAKHSRLRHEAELTARAQLRDGAALREAIEALDGVGEGLERRLDALEQTARQGEYSRLREGREGAEARGRRFGFLSAQKERWAREFGRVVATTRVEVAPGEVGAVAQVIAVFQEGEAKNSSLFRMVNSDVAAQIDELDHELAALAEHEARLLAAHEAEARREATGDNPAARRAAVASKTVEMEQMADHVARALADVMPELDALCGSIGLEMPGELRAQSCSLSNIDEFLVQIEARLLSLYTKAQVFSHKSDDVSEASPVPRRAEPPLQPTQQELLFGWTTPKELARAPPLNSFTVRARGVDEIDG